MATLILCFCLIIARVSAFVAALPVFGGRSVPRLVKVGLVVALAVAWFDVLFGTVPAAELQSRTVQSSWLALAIALGREVVLGALVGFAFGLFLLPARIAGELISQESGLGFGAMLDPLGGSSGGPLPQLFELVSILFILGLDTHHVFLTVLHGTFADYPVGATLPEVPVQRLVAGLAAAQEWGVLLAMPVALYLFVTSLVLIVLTRAAPQLNLYSVGFPMRIAMGLGATLLLLPSLTSGIVSSFGELGRLLTGSG